MTAGRKVGTRGVETQGGGAVSEVRRPDEAPKESSSGEARVRFLDVIQIMMYVGLVSRRRPAAEYFDDVVRDTLF